MNLLRVKSRNCISEWHSKSSINRLRADFQNIKERQEQTATKKCRKLFAKRFREIIVLEAKL